MPKNVFFSAIKCNYNILILYNHAKHVVARSESVQIDCWKVTQQNKINYSQFISVKQVAIFNYKCTTTITRNESFLAGTLSMDGSACRTCRRASSPCDQLCLSRARLLCLRGYRVLSTVDATKSVEQDGRRGRLAGVLTNGISHGIEQRT